MDEKWHPFTMFVKLTGEDGSQLIIFKRVFIRRISRQSEGEDARTEHYRENLGEKPGVGGELDELA